MQSNFITALEALSLPVSQYLYDVRDNLCAVSDNKAHYYYPFYKDGKQYLLRPGSAPKFDFNDDL